MANLLNATWYARITGLALAATALLGIIMSLAADGAFVAGFLEFDWTHNVVHVLLAAVALYVGFGAPTNYAALYAKLFGAVYLALGIVGFLVPDLVVLHLELGENLVHLLIGGYGLAAGFLGSEAPEPRAAAVPRRG